MHMERNTSLHINEAVLHNAFQYAESKGMDLSTVVESFLIRMLSVDEKDKIKKFPISDKVRSLAGRMKSNVVMPDAKKVKEDYLKEKYDL